MKKLKKFKLSNKGKYPANVLANIEGYRLDENPECFVVNTERYQEFCDRIEDCINSFPKTTNFFWDVAYDKIIFYKYFVDGESLENLSSKKQKPVYFVELEITRIIDLLSLKLYRDIILDDIDESYKYTINDSIISLDNRIKNCLSRYCYKEMYTDQVNQGIEYLYDLFNLIDWQSDNLSLDERIFRAFEPVRGIGDYYQKFIKGIYTLYKKYISSHSVENLIDVDDDSDKKYPVGSKERYNDFIEEEYYPANNIIKDDIDQEINIKDDIEYSRNKVTLYDAIKTLQSLNCEVISLGAYDNNGFYTPMYNDGNIRLKREVLLEALEIFFYAKYK